MSAPVDYYDSTYAAFAERVSAEVRREVYDVDIGQNSWLTAAEQERFGALLALAPGRKLIEFACGSGGPALFLARRFGADVAGLDINPAAIAAARAAADAAGLAHAALFDVVDGNGCIPFADSAADALQCIDSVNHIADRAALLAEWRRVLRPGGLLLFTDPVVVTGPVSGAELAVRGSIGFFLFVPPGENERFLAAAGFELLRAEDATANAALIAGRWVEARAARRDDLSRIEGEETFAGKQRFFAAVRDLAASGRLSRRLFLARRR